MIRWVVEQFIERPLAAFISSVEILGQGLEGGQTVDAIMGRIIHTLSCTSGRAGETWNGATDGCEGKKNNPAPVGLESVQSDD